MKKLSKDQIRRKDELIKAIAEAKAKVEDAISIYNADKATAFEKVEYEIDKYNSVIESIIDLQNEVAEEMQDYMSERSDNWHESDAGQEYADWNNEWENISLEALEDSYPEDFEMDIEDVEEKLNELRNSVQE
jgi:hypothetical protein